MQEGPRRPAPRAPPPPAPPPRQRTAEIVFLHASYCDGGAFWRAMLAVWAMVGVSRFSGQLILRLFYREDRPTYEDSEPRLPARASGPAQTRPG